MSGQLALGLEFCPHCGGRLDEELENVDGNRLGGFARDSETSRKAALENFPRSGSQRRRVLLIVVRAGHAGRTSDEIADRYEINLYSVKPRLLELRRGGWVRRTGERRTTGGSKTGSDVYVPTARALEEIARDPDMGRWIP